MEYIGKKQMKQVQRASVFYLALLFLCICLVFMRGLKNLEPVYILNITADIYGMLIGYVLFVCCIIDVQKTGANLRYLLYLLGVSYIGLFTDAGAWLVQGVPELRIINILDNTVYYLCAPIAAYCFWHYVMNYLSVKTQEVKEVEKVIKLGLIISLALRIINIFTGIYFVVGRDGFYERAGIYPLSMIYMNLTLLAAVLVIIKERKQLKKYQIIILSLYVLAPFFVGILTILVYGLSISYPVIMTVLLLMYCLLNVSQGRDKAVADRELNVASNIQEHILPSVFPYMPEREEFDLFASMNPAKEIGGDFYDFFMIDDDHLVLVIADVSGKGIPAALFMMVSRTLIKNQTLNNRDFNPAEILGLVNSQLCEGNEMEMFVTCYLAILTISTGELVYANAGHEYPAVQRAGEKFDIVKEKHSPPLAVMDKIKFRSGRTVLNPGDAMFVYTDGITEATNSLNELFGTDRMLNALNMDHAASARELDTNVRRSIKYFVGDAPQFDDMTTLCLRFYGGTH